MDMPSVQSQSSTATAATSPSSPGAGNYNSSSMPGQGNSSPQIDAPTNEDSKFKENNAMEEDNNDINTITDLNMLIIEDSTLDKVPIHLEKLFRSLDASKSTSADLLIAIIYGLALESSFAAVDEIQKFESLNINPSNQIKRSAFDSNIVKLLSNMPMNIFNANKMSYTLRLQLHFDPKSVCLMTGILTGDFLILTLTPQDGNSTGKSICLSVGRYVLNASGKPFPSRLRKLPELAYKLREYVFVPVRKYLIQKDDLFAPYPSLEFLPFDLYEHLYMYLNKKHLNVLVVSCRKFSETVTHYERHKRLKKK